LNFAGLEVSARKECFRQGKKQWLHLNASGLPLDHFELLMPMNQQAKRQVTVLAGVSESDYSREIGLL